MVKAGDILKFAEPVHWWDKKLLDKGGKYIIKYYKDIGELCLTLKISNGGYGYGKFSQYAVRPFEVVGNVFENGESK